MAGPKTDKVRQNKKPQRMPTAAQVEDAIRKAAGNVSAAARVLASNFVSLPVDSIVFTALAFVLLPPVFGAESMPLAQAITQIASGQILYKAVVTILSLPLIYTIKDKPIDPNWQLAD